MYIYIYIYRYIIEYIYDIYLNLYLSSVDWIFQVSKGHCTNPCIYIFKYKYKMIKTVIKISPPWEEGTSSLCAYMDLKWRYAFPTLHLSPFHSKWLK